MARRPLCLTTVCHCAVCTTAPCVIRRRTAVVLPRVRCVAANGVVLDRNPLSECLLARPHGRVEMLLTALRIGLVLLLSVRDTLGVAVVVTVVCLAALAQLYSLLYYLPFYHQSMNQYQCGFALVFMWASLCSAMAFVRDQPSSEAEAFLLLFSFPAISFSGYSLARQRLRHLNVGSPESAAMLSPLLVEVRARLMLQPVTQGNAASPRAGVSDSSTPIIGTFTESVGGEGREVRAIQE
jgi:hypothetical protein